MTAPSRDIDVLLKIMADLRHPETGCPWDIKQTFSSIKPYTVEEAYEVADAIERGDMDDLCDELGDLLLQVVFHARIAEERAYFDFGEVVRAITAKLVRRHPHVFQNAAAGDATAVKRNWEDIKAEERQQRRRKLFARGIDPDAIGHLDDVPRALPALSEAYKLQKKAAKVGFDWSQTGPILDKIEEEIGELREALAAGCNKEIRDELGDLVFALANLARHAEIDPEEALRATNTKFRRRFAHIEKELRRDEIALEDAGLDRMEKLWQSAKKIERSIGSETDEVDFVKD